MSVIVIIGRILVTLVLALATLWGASALWLRLPMGDIARGGVAAAFVAVMLAALVLMWQQRPFPAMGVVALAWVVLLGWWATILPSNNRVWETRQYRLSRLTGADLFLSYWAGENVAHAIISFDFKDSDPLAFSIEIRKEKGEQYSSTAGFFKTYELAIIAADERDVVKLRSTVRGEDVRIYRLDIQQATALGLLREYVALASDVSARPRWYHTLAANCTTVIFGMARRLDPKVALDWRILLPGKLPSYLREHEFVSRTVPLDTLVAAAKIGPRAAGPDADFSRRIRQGVPDPAGGGR